MGNQEEVDPAPTGITLDGLFAADPAQEMPVEAITVDCLISNAKIAIMLAFHGAWEAPKPGAR
jgi:hypothetical protein